MKPKCKQAWRLSQRPKTQSKIVFFGDAYKPQEKGTAIFSRFSFLVIITPVKYYGGRNYTPHHENETKTHEISQLQIS